MFDQTVAESLFYAVVKLTALLDGEPSHTGTGFFMSFRNEVEETDFAIFTNKHVLEGADQVEVVFHLGENGAPSGKLVSKLITIDPTTYVGHPDGFVDLCALRIGEIVKRDWHAGTPLYFRPLGVEIIPTENGWANFDAMEEVTMIGCPNGIFDEVNNLPIARRGITASPLAKKYNGKNEFMVDMACFPGSSGSPVFVYDRNGYTGRHLASLNQDRQGIIFVGILYSGPIITNEGKIVLADSPSVSIGTMMHLGHVIRSSAVQAIIDELQGRG